jgi:nucleoside-diphosphate-sugar epimerase
LGVRILAFGRDLKRAKNLIEKSGVSFFSRDIRDPLKIDNRVDYIFHCASMTKSRDMISDPVSVIKTSLDGTKNILELAREKQVKSIVYLSSMEVYGNTDPSLEFVTEDIQGFIDLTSPRGCYPMSKRMCECMCNCWHAQYGVPVKTARLAQTFGAGTPKTDSRVFGVGIRMNSLSKPKQFLELHGKPIILHTIKHFERHDNIDAICVVCVASWIGELKFLLQRYSVRKVSLIAEGGNSPQESVYKEMSKNNIDKL